MKQKNKIEKDMILAYIGISIIVWSVVSCYCCKDHTVSPYEIAIEQEENPYII